MKKPADVPRERDRQERPRVKPLALSPLPPWSEIPLRAQRQLVAAVCQMVVAQLPPQCAAPEVDDEQADA
jgi:hypothetical protein